jgi:hypothetical protein
VRSPEPPPTGALPPWATSLKGAPVFLEDTGPVAPKKGLGEPLAPTTDEVEIFPRRRGSDSTIGLPERINQAPLPFERPVTNEAEESEPVEERAEDEAFGEGQEAAASPDGRESVPEDAPGAESQAPAPREPILPVRESEPRGLPRADVLSAGEIEEAEPRPPFSISVFFKSKTFDLLFVGLFWLVALWLAAASLDITLFDVLGAMSGSMLMLYAVFVLLYFFLFKFFLGETIGDRLFRPRD